jgi:hypothetical protein
VEGRIVEQYDGAALHAAGHPLGDLRGGDVLPVQAVPAGNRFKCLRCKGSGGFRVLRVLWLNSCRYRQKSFHSVSQFD